MTYLKPYQLPTTHLALSPAVFAASRPAMGSSTTSRCLAARGLKGHAGTGPAAEDVHAQTRTWTVSAGRSIFFQQNTLRSKKSGFPEDWAGPHLSRYALCFWQTQELVNATPQIFSGSSTAPLRFWLCPRQLSTHCQNRSPRS